MAESANSVNDVVNICRDENYNTPVLESHIQEVEKLSITDSLIAVTDNSLMNVSASECSKQNTTFKSSLAEMPVIMQVSCGDEFNLISQDRNDAYEIESSIIGATTECSISVTESICFQQNKSLNNNLIEVSEDSKGSASNECGLISQNTNQAYVNVKNCNSEICDADYELTGCKPDKLVDLSDIDSNVSSDGFGEVFSEFNNANCLQVKDEEFHDAVQFFKDPSSIAFLESAGAATVSSDPMVTRSSLYVNFDPLHSKFSNQLTNRTNGLQLINEAETVSGSVCEGGEITEPKVTRNILVNTSRRESLNNILISFDSPVGVKTVDSNQAEESFVPEKEYSENKLQQALKIRDLYHQEILLKKQQEFELELAKKQQESVAKINQQNELCIAQREILKELASISSEVSLKNRELQKCNENLELGTKKLKEELKTAAEDIQSIESSFTDFHKRYEQCKSMLKVYKENEHHLKQQTKNLQAKLLEQEQMHTTLQSKTQEMLENANVEMANAKKSNEGQVAVLKAQLKKAELKIGSLESDIKQVKTENSKLGGICDDLMAKVSET